MLSIEEQIKNEQAQQLIQKLNFFEELVLYIESCGGVDIGIDQAILIRDVYRAKFINVVSENAN